MSLSRDQNTVFLFFEVQIFIKVKFISLRFYFVLYQFKRPVFLYVILQPFYRPQLTK